MFVSGVEMISLVMFLLYARELAPFIQNASKSI
jgi:hypothetical protein